MTIWGWLSSKGRTGSAPLPAEGAGAERRVAPRFRSTRVTSCSMIKLPASIPVAAELRDISQTGIGLLCHTPVEAGAFLVVDLAGPRQFFCQLQVRVVHATQQSKKDWVIGCVLTRELSAKELEAFW